MIGDTQYFPFKGIMLHTENHIIRLVDHLHSLLKLLSVFKIRLLYVDAIVIENVPDSVETMCINCVIILVVC